MGYSNGFFVDLIFSYLRVEIHSDAVSSKVFNTGNWMFGDRHL